MFLIPLSLQNISQLKDPSERVPLGERLPYEQGVRLVEGEAFAGFELSDHEDKLLRLSLFWDDTSVGKKVQVRISEEKPHGPLFFACSYCTEVGRQALSCPHQWASYIFLWQTLTLPKTEHELARDV